MFWVGRGALQGMCKKMIKGGFILMKGGRLLLAFSTMISFVSCLSAQSSAQQTSLPEWVNNLERVYPSRDWIAVTAEGRNQTQAENAAMSALARAFRTDINSLTQSAQRYTQIIEGTTGAVIFNESRNFSHEINVNSNIHGLIGVQTDVYRSASAGSFTYVLARMNRRECSARYSAMIAENTAIINRLITSAASFPNQANLDVYSRLSFAHSLAQVTDNFQNILEVLDPTAVNRKPSYGTANAIKLRMLETASLITIGISVNTEQLSDRAQYVEERTLLRRAAGSFFRDLGFRTNEHGTGNYILSVNVRFEEISQNVFSCRYYLNASLTDASGISIFTFTEDDRKAHPNNANEARRLAVRAAEESFKEGKFAGEFNTWLMRNN